MLALLLAALAVTPPLDAIAATAHGRVGFAAEIVETPGATLALDAAGHFPMQSVYKLPIAMAVLHAGHVTPAVRELLRAAIVDSDNHASDALLELARGPAAVERFVHEIGVGEIAIATSERTMGEDELAQYRNWCTPRAALELLRAAMREPFLVELMTASRPGAARIKALLPRGTVVAHKTGSSGTTNGLTRATNDIGVVTLPDGRHLAVAVFVSDAHAATPACEAVIAKLARAAYDWAISR